MNSFKLSILLAFLLFFNKYSNCEITKEKCEEWIISTLNTADDASVKIYILDSIHYIPSNRFLPEIKKLSLLSSKTNQNIYLKSLYVLYKVYKSTPSLEKIVDFLLQKPQRSLKDNPVIKAKIYIKNQLRAEAAKMLGELGDERHLEVLSKIIKEDDEGMVSDACYFALAMLSKRGKIKKLDELKEFFYSGLKDTDPKVRLKAVKYLGELSYPDALGPLSLRLKDVNKEVVTETILSLGKIGDPSIFQELLQFKTHQDVALRVALAEALGNIGRSILNSGNFSTLEKIKSVISSLMNDTHGMVKVTSAVALLKISDKSGLEVIKKGLNSTDTDVVLYCLENLGNYGSLEDIKLLENFTQHQELIFRAYSYVNILKIYYREGK
ncbi:MAG: hypothetical protein ABDH23_00510 [Endomicrobiia bacterium]